MFLRQRFSGSGPRPAPGPRPASLVLLLRRVDPRGPELRPDLGERDALALVRHVDVRRELAQGLARLGAQDGAAGGRLLGAVPVRPHAGVVADAGVVVPVGRVGEGALQSGEGCST